MVALPNSSYLLQLNTVTCTLAKVVLRRTTSDSDSRPLRNLSYLWHLGRLPPASSLPLHHFSIISFLLTLMQPPI